MARVAIILLNYNSANLVIESLEKLVKFETQPCIIIVNNDVRDTDYIANKIKEFNNIDIHLINSDVNCGYARGNNIGLRYALERLSVKFCVIANPDVDIEECAIDKFENFLFLNPNYLAVSGQMINNVGDYLLSHWSIPGPLSDFINTSSIVRLLCAPDFQERTSKDVEILQGAFTMYNLRNFSSIGFFDERTFLYGEERIVGWKANEASLPMYFMSDVKFKHKVGASINLSHTTTISKYLMMHKSREIYYKYFVRNNYKRFLYRFLHAFLLLEKFFVSIIKGIICAIK